MQACKALHETYFLNKAVICKHQKKKHVTSKTLHTSGSFRRNVQNIYILKVVPDKLNQKFSDQTSVGEATFTLFLQANPNTTEKLLLPLLLFLFFKLCTLPANKQ